MNSDYFQRFSAYLDDEFNRAEDEEHEENMKNNSFYYHTFHAQDSRRATSSVRKRLVKQTPSTASVGVTSDPLLDKRGQNEFQKRREANKRWENILKRFSIKEKPSSALSQRRQQQKPKTVARFEIATIEDGAIETDQAPDISAPLLDETQNI